MRLRSLPALVALAATITLTGCSKGADTTSPTATGKDSAILACKVLAELPAEGFDFPQDEVAMGRLSALDSLARLAKTQDGAYKDLGENALQLKAVAMATFSASGPKWQQAYANVKASCDKLQ